MYAIIESGGQQHKVAEGEVIRMQLLTGQQGEVVEFDKVILISSEGQVDLGKPYLADKKVKAEIVAHGRAKKIQIIKFRRRKHSMKRQGHRQWYTDVKITSVG